MKFSIDTKFTTESIDVGEFAQRVEELGFESLWVPEHPVIPAYPSVGPGGVVGALIPEGMSQNVDQFTALTVAATATSTLRLGTGVCLVPEHHPIDLAKRIATLDLYSNGRFSLGVGAGWSPEESAAMGGNFARRWGQTREAIHAMKALWTEDEPEFHGEFYDFPPLLFNPKPIQKPYPPILLGGSSKNVFNRIATWADGWYSTNVTPEEVEAGRIEMDRLYVENDRDPATIDITLFRASPEPEAVKAFQAVGVDRFTFAVDSYVDSDPFTRLEEVAHMVGL
jgi:probable F420-dependent oxidoreductase|tara:strand:- start:244 stop:1089 length:846 start_codon:yes stop_codon:yes gene_type:complete